jgi:serine/threonine protein kinase
MQDVSTKFSTKGTVVANRYIIDELLGTGGFGAVYRVQDRRVRGNVFALKEVANPNAHERQSFMSECAILKRLDHDGLPHVYRVFEDHEHHRVYMLMDYIDGPNLEQLRQQQPGKRLPFSRVMKIMAPIIDAIIYLHAQQPPIIHRDIKPANIIVPPNDDGTVLVDFGIAKEYEPDSTTTAIRHCSPGYGSPEHYATGTDIRTDIYSLGATFYALLAGVVPTDALYRMAQMSSKGIDPLVKVNTWMPALSGELAEILARAMAINSADRFASVEEFWQALQACQIDDEPVEVVDKIASEQPVETTPMLSATISPDVVVGKLPQSTGRQKWLVASLCSVVLVALLSGVVWGAGLLPWGQQYDDAVIARTSTRTSIGAVRSPGSTATSTQQVVVTTPTVQPSVSPAPTVATEYPALTGRYDGTISNKFTTPSTDTSMSLSQLQQDGAAIRGYFSVGSGLVGNGNFTGTVTTDNKIQFLVPGYGGLLPLFFSGQIQQDGSLSGSYCSYQENRCNFAGGGHGAWHVNPS